jgi:hypothetical protein
MWSPHGVSHAAVERPVVLHPAAPDRIDVSCELGKVEPDVRCLHRRICPLILVRWSNIENVAAGDHHRRTIPPINMPAAELLVRIGVATVLGLAIGIERGLASRSASASGPAHSTSTPTMRCTPATCPPPLTSTRLQHDFVRVGVSGVCHVDTLDLAVEAERGFVVVVQRHR